MVKSVLLFCLALLIAAVGASVVWFRERLPPNCTDPRTLALVHQSLTGRFHLPQGTTMTDIRTIAGGYLAMRFVCQADLSGFDPHALPPGTTIPGWVHYISQLTPDRQRHEVTVSIQPVLEWEQVQ